MSTPSQPQPPAHPHPHDDSSAADPASAASRPVHQLRLVVHADDYEEALRFFRDVIGMPEQEAYSGEGGAEVTILDAGRATLELANTAQVEMIDEVEVGSRVSPRFRVALEVTDSAAATTTATDAGASLIAPPVRTPWNSLNSRLEVPGGIQLTFFQELASPTEPRDDPSGSN